MGGFKIKISKTHTIGLIFCLFIFFYLLPFVCNAQENIDISEKQQSTKISEKNKESENFSENKNEPQPANGQDSNKTANENNSNNQKYEFKNENKENAVSKKDLYKTKEHKTAHENSEGNVENGGSSGNSEKQTENNLNLPELEGENLEFSSLEIPKKPETLKRNLTKTIVAWVLISIGFLIIITTVILNFWIPKKVRLKYGSNWYPNSKKRKNKYQIKFK